MFNKMMISLVIFLLLAGKAYSGAKNYSTIGENGLHFHEDFESIEALGWEKNIDRGRETKIKIVTQKNAIPLTVGGHALSIEGENLWNGGSIIFEGKISLAQEVFVKADFWTSGAADTIGLLVSAEGIPFTHCKYGPATVKNFGGWSTAVWRVNDYFLEQLYEEPQNIYITGIKFIQRVHGGGEKPGFKGEYHRLVIDNVIVASGKASEPLKKIIAEKAGHRYYKGRNNFIIPGIKKIKVWHSPSTAKVFENQPIPSIENHQVEISGARNEYESFQLVFHAEENREGFSVQSSDFIGSEGNRIHSDNIRWHPVYYLPIRSRYFGIACNQKWPGPLSWNREFNLQKSINQPVWFTVYIPKGIPAGEYKGKINVSQGQKILGQVLVTITVWNFDFPDEVTFRTNQQVWLNTVPNPWYSGKRRDLMEETAKLLSMYHMVDANSFGRYPRDLQNTISNEYGVNTIKLPFCGGHGGGKKRKVTKFRGHDIYTPEYEKEFSTWLNLQADHYRSQKLLDRCFLYLWDEPWGDFEVVEMIKYLGGLARKTVPELKTLVASAYFEDPAIDIYLAGYTESLTRKQAIKKGKEFWWWGNAHMFIDLPGIDARMAWGMESIQKDITGEYSWGIFTLKTGARKIKNGSENKNEDMDWPYTDPWHMVGRWNYNSIVIWPGNHPESESEKLVSSINLELLRDGIEDYEYYQMILKGRKKLKDTDKPLARKCDTLIELMRRFYRDPKGLREDFNTVERLAALRKETAECLERLKTK